MKWFKYVKTPRLIGGYIIRHFLSRQLSDEKFVRWEYFFQVGKFPNLVNPKTFNEKLQWLKLNNIHSEYTKLVDKYLVKQYVEQMIGIEYIIPTLGVWNEFSEIDFSKLPNRFVLKTTHDSGGVAIVKDKSTVDMKKVRRRIERSLRHNYYYDNREYPYKEVEPKIIAEKYMVDESGFELKDYKIFCFEGEPQIIQVDYGRFTHHKRNMYDTNWNRLPFTLKFPTDWNREIPKPEGLDDMLDVARKLSKGFPHIRVDLYNINGKIYFGELTFFHGSGHEKFSPEEWNYRLGEWIQLKK